MCLVPLLSSYVYTGVMKRLQLSNWPSFIPLLMTRLFWGLFVYGYK